jgi:hypothetical protein
MTVPLIIREIVERFRVQVEYESLIPSYSNPKVWHPVVGLTV